MYMQVPTTTHLVLEEVLSLFESTQLLVELVVGEAAGVGSSKVVAKVVEYVVKLHLQVARGHLLRTQNCPGRREREREREREKRERESTKFKGQSTCVYDISPVTLYIKFVFSNHKFLILR